MGAMIAFRTVLVSLARRPHHVALGAVLVAALALRLFGLTWDEGRYLHPDERHVADVTYSRIFLDGAPLSNLLDPDKSGLNPRTPDAEGRPRGFAYGALPLLVVDAVAEVLTWFSDRDWHWYDNIYLIGRPISALLDTGTVLIVYLIGTRVFNRRVGLLGAVVAALAPMSIQLAHFFTTDAWLTFFVALCLLWAIRAAEGGQRRWFAATGAAFGLAMATKGSVFTLGGVVAVAVVYDVWRRWRAGATPLAALTAAPERIAVAGVAALGCFALFEPYALLSPGPYRRSLEEQANIVRGIIDVPYTRQYVGTTPMLYQAEQLVRFGFGPVAGVLALLGLPWLAYRFWRHPTGGRALLLAWFLGYTLVIALPETKFLRYLAPLTPVLAVAAGLALDGIWGALARWRGPRLAGLAGAVLLAGAGLWTAAFSTIYAHENTRLAASRWMFANLPPGSVLSGEYWDDPLPSNLGPGFSGADFQFETVWFDIYADRPVPADLRTIGAAFAATDATASAGESLDRLDYRSAAASLRELTTQTGRWSQPDRERLADALDHATGDLLLLPPNYELGDAARALARALRDEATVDPAERIAPSLDRLAAALEATGDAQATEMLYRGLDQVDYYVVSSNRVMDSVPRSPWRYPVQTRFYDLLESGELGFRLEKEFTRYPSLGPFSISDHDADESFINYDHPRVLIFAKERLVDRETFAALFADATAAPVSPTRHAPETKLQLDEPVGELPVVADARWSAAWTSNSWVALGAWLILLAALQIVGWPLAGLVFGRFADAGWGFARLISLILGGYVVWIGASLPLFAFRAVWAAAALLVLAVVGWAARERWRRRTKLWTVRPAQRRTALGTEAAFWLVFALFLLFRYLNPDSWHPIWGGEKPMEFAHLNGILRSAHFPPLDPWYAGGYINYYYYGLYLVAFCAKVTGIPSEIAFNLAQPTMLALLASTGFALAATIGRDLVHRARYAIPAGALGVLFLVGIGNLDGLVQYLRRPADVGDGFGYYTWDPTRLILGNNTITEFPFFTGLYADLHAHVVALPITVLVLAIGYALARDPRGLALALRRPRRRPALGAALTVRLVLLAIAVGSLMPTNAWDVPTYLGLSAAALFMATSAIRPLAVRLGVAAGLATGLGALAYALFLPFHTHYVALFGSLGRTRVPSPFWQFADHLGGLLLLVGIGIVAALVAWISVSGAPLLDPALPLLVLATILIVRGSVLGNDEPLASALTTAFVTTIAAVLGLAGWYAIGSRNDRTARLAGRGGLATGLTAAGAALAVDRPTMALALAMATAAVAVWVFGTGIGQRFVGLMVGTACALAAGIEVVFVADNLAGGDAERMNTVFKFYNQIWVLLALAAAAFVARMLADARLGGGGDRPDAAALGIVGPASRLGAGTRDDDWVRTHTALSPVALWSRAGLGLAVLVVAASLVYPVTATGPRLRQRFTDDLGSQTLNGLDWMDYGTLTVETGRRDATGAAITEQISFAGDRAAIDWLNKHVDGSPVIAEAAIGGYRGNGSRIAIATGLPVVIGWDYHLSQQRYPEGLQERVADLRALYNATEPVDKMAILRRYDVEYVVVGDIERKWRGDDGAPYASADGLAAFDEMVGTALEVVFQEGATTVYRVAAGGSG